MLVLEVHEGAHRRSLLLDVNTVRIGRDRECDVSLPGDPTVSRLHAVLQTESDGWLLIDQGSRNGTFVNGRRVTGSVKVASLDRILIGQFLLVMRDGEDGSIETAAAEEVGVPRHQLATGLSARELEVLRLLCAGHSDRAIADELVVSIKTVHSHLERIRDKTGCRRRPELIRYGMTHGIA